MVAIITEKISTTYTGRVETITKDSHPPKAIEIIGKRKKQNKKKKAAPEDDEALDVEISEQAIALQDEDKEEVFVERRSGKDRRDNQLDRGRFLNSRSGKDRRKDNIKKLDLTI